MTASECAQMVTAAGVMNKNKMDYLLIFDEMSLVEKLKVDIKSTNDTKGQKSEP